MGKLPFEKIKREMLIRHEVATHVSEELAMDELINYGIVNVDKPKGPTSHQTAEFVKNIFGLKKAGHSGTLDPGVTGVLPCAIGKATRITQALLPAGKEYVALMYLHREIDEETIRKAFADYTGKIMQLPPVKSAVRRIERPRSVYYIDILEIDNKHVLFRIGCEAGTYIRKYIHDLGKRIGCGAHMAQLRRSKVATFDESTAFTLQDIADAVWYYRNEKNESFLRKIIQPIETGVRHLPHVWAGDGTLAPISHGRDLAVPGIVKVESGIVAGELVAVMSTKDTLVSLGIAQMDSEKMVSAEKGIAVKNDKVFLPQ
ncbi:MAG: RNA-guided pseudouridylation complex pseudouridine synthase subunit Cbf5 [Nanoarchaeota archaeon]|nr:RNA-guided pseudouridylation complex pseudouridine synthase subunit Cbf5 [Nanoarchaeota archaeon]